MRYIQQQQTNRYHCEQSIIYDKNDSKITQQAIVDDIYISRRSFFKYQSFRNSNSLRCPYNDLHRHKREAAIERLTLNRQLGAIVGRVQLGQLIDSYTYRLYVHFCLQSVVRNQILFESWHPIVVEDS
jgi:hypothetical protein